MNVEVGQAWLRVHNGKGLGHALVIAVNGERIHYKYLDGLYKGETYSTFRADWLSKFIFPKPIISDKIYVGV